MGCSVIFYELVRPNRDPREPSQVITGPTKVSEANTSHVEQLAHRWAECGLTRPWNDQVADARLAIQSPIFKVFIIEDPELVASAMAGFDGRCGGGREVRRQDARRRRPS